VAKKFVPVNLYNPHAEVEDEKKKKHIVCPGTYSVPTQFFNPENHLDADKNIHNLGGRAT
jgi:hypothetical protein